MKFKEAAVTIIKDKLENEELEAINVLLKGQTRVNSVKKSHLEAFKKIIDLMSQELNWRESEEISVQEPKKETQDDNQDDNQENFSEDQQKKEVCRFFKNGQCRHGKNGKKPNQLGKVCSFSHPPTCKKFLDFGYKEHGCKSKKCGKLHVNLCKIFMRHKSCKFEDKCRFWHPKKLKNNNPHNINYSSQKHMEEKFSYADIVTKNSQPRNDFLGHHSNQQLIGSAQVQQVQQPFLEKMSGIDPQVKILDLLVSLNHRLMNLEKDKSQA